MGADFVTDALGLWPVIVPLLGAALVLLLRRVPLVQRTATELTVVAMFIVSVLLMMRTAAGDTFIVNFGGWGAPFGVTFVADMLSAMLCAAAGVVALAVVIFARADIRARRRRAGFDPLFLAMLAAVNGAVLTGDIFNLYVWFELMLVTAVGLITIDRRRAQIDGAMRYIAMSMMGATFILLGIGLLYGETGTLDMAQLSTILADRAPSMTVSASGYLILAGLALKAGMFPLFFWLPASYHTAPISIAAALAGLLTKVAFYACLRILIAVFGMGAETTMVPGMSSLLVLLSTTTMIVSVLAAIAQVDVRRMLAMHVVGQVSYLVLALALASFVGSAAAIFYTVHTMIVQTGLFLGAGAIARVANGYDLRTLGSLIGEHPRFTAMFSLLVLSISGIPPLSGFWAKALVIDATFRSGMPGAGWLAAVALVAGFLTLYSMSILWMQAFWRPRTSLGHVRQIPPAMVVAVGLLAACTLGLGIAIEPAVRFSRYAATQLMSDPSTRVVSPGGAP